MIAAILSGSIKSGVALRPDKNGKKYIEEAENSPVFATGLLRNED